MRLYHLKEPKTFSVSATFLRAVIFSSLLLTSCGVTQRACQLALTPYMYTTAVVSNTGSNAEFRDFDNSKNSCRRQHEEEIVAIYQEVIHSKHYRALKSKYVDTQQFPDFILPGALQHSKEKNDESIAHWKSKLDQGIINYSSPAGHYNVPKVIAMLEEVNSKGWNTQYSKKFETIISNCLRKTYKPEEIERLSSIKFSTLPMPSTPCLGY